MSYQDGINTRRLEREPDERVFYVAWNLLNHDARQLDYMLDPLCSGRNPTPSSDEEQKVASTVIQWLGTHCGKIFLENCGYTKDILRI
jgi:hypothetical protein